jgi:hypothetical protein
MAAMTDRLQRQWTIWCISLAIFLAFLVAGHMASTARVTVVTLQPDVTGQITLFSPLGHDVYFDLDFSRAAAKGNDDSLRSMELGGPRRNGSGAEIILPGEPVVIEASLDGAPPVRLRATPANRSNRFTIGRSLRADGIKAVSFPAEERDGISALKVRPGVNQVSFRVLQVGGSLRGEDVELVAQPPLRAGAQETGYGIFVMVFWLMPVAMMAFIITGMALLTRGAKQAGYRGTLAGGD